MDHTLKFVLSLSFVISKIKLKWLKENLAWTRTLRIKLNIIIQYLTMHTTYFIMKRLRARAFMRFRSLQDWEFSGDVISVENTRPLWRVFMYQVKFLARVSNSQDQKINQSLVHSSALWEMCLYLAECFGQQALYG